MKAVVFHDVGDIRVEDVPDPTIQEPLDAVVQISTSAICGTDLHMVRGTMTGMQPGTILGHEGVGIVQEVGPQVHNLKEGDRVVVLASIACGYCSYCRAGYYSQCDNANPHGPLAGPAFFGGPADSGPFNGLQAEYVRVPFATTGLVKIPDEVSDSQAVLLSDIFPTGYFGAEMADIEPGRTVAVFGCGPVGQFAIMSAFMLGAGRVFAVDTIPSRLDMAMRQGAEAIDYNLVDPVETLRSLTGGIGVDRAIDCVGVDANAPTSGPALQQYKQLKQKFQQELGEVAPKQRPSDGEWHAGDAPSQVLMWEAEALAKGGTLSIIGVYPKTVSLFPIGQAMMKNFKINMGNCNHRRYVPKLLETVRAGQVNPAMILTETQRFNDILDAYKHFDKREPGWVKVDLSLARGQRRRAA